MTPFDRHTRPGQPETLTLAGPEHGPAQGHWYSPAVVARLVEWQKAVLDALTQTGADAGPEMDPREAVRQLIRWETRQALDPLVSSDAQALLDRGRRQGLAEVAQVCHRLKDDILSEVWEDRYADDLAWLDMILHRINILREDPNEGVCEI